MKAESNIVLNLETRRAAHNYYTESVKESSYRRQGLIKDAGRCKVNADREYLKFINLSARGGRM